MALTILMVAACLAGTWSAGGVAAQEVQSPAAIAEDVRAMLVDAQLALMDGNQQGAEALASDARDLAAPLLAAFEGTSDAGEQLAAALDDASAAAGAGDGPGLAFARAAVWSAMVKGAFDAAVDAALQGDAGSAGNWLLLRDFRESNRMAVSSTGATDALMQLQEDESTTDEAAQAIRSDLLSTYQGKLNTTLDALESGSSQELDLRVAESAGAVAGYWTILAPSYEAQFGAAELARVQGIIDGVAEAALNDDPEALAGAVDELRSTLNTFRAAPLLENEKARLAGQTLLYLSLVSVEYGRGVKDGQVVVEIEIQEAQSFLSGFSAAFLDLRPTLQELDPEGTARVQELLDALKAGVGQALVQSEAMPAGELDALTDEATSILKSLYPSEWERAGGDADFDVIASLLDEMERAVAAGQYSQAKSARLEAYAIFDAGAEKRLLAFAPGVARDIEAMSWQGDGSHEGLLTLIQDEAGGKQIRAARVDLDNALDAARQQIGQGSTARGAIIFNSASIVFREGLEVVLILVSLTASMVGANRRFKLPLAIGAGLAFVATVALFFLARSVLMSLSRYGEKLEAIVSVAAIGVLLIVMNWFFHKVYWTKWIAGHHARRRAILSGAAGQMAGLMLLGFTSVFREGGETVLFLQALVLDAGTRVVIEGVLLGLAGVFVVGVLVFALQKKLPHKKMLKMTGIMLAFVLVTMVGTTVHVLQVVGWAPITPIAELRLPYWTGVWLGTYATWEGVIAQALAVVLVVGSYFLAEYLHDRSLDQRSAMAASSTSSSLASS